MSKPTPPVRLRMATEEDAPFIFNSWLKSYRKSFFARTITNTVYFSEHHKIIEKLLKKYQTVVACNNDDPTQVYGFINAGFTDGIFTLNFIYVKHSFRGLGIAKALFNAFEHDPSYAAVYTHHCRIAEKLASKYNMLNHPYILFSEYLDAPAPTPVEEESTKDEPTTESLEDAE